MHSTSAPPAGARRSASQRSASQRSTSQRSASQRVRRAAVLAAGLLGVGLLGVPAAAAPADPAAAPAASKKLNISQQVQQQNQWCWVGSGLTIAKFLGKDQGISQNGFCDLARGYPQGSQCPNQAGQLEWVQRAYQGLGMNPGQVSNPLSFSTVQSQINAGKPIETGIYWTAGGGHAQVIYGYDSSTSSIFYGDPWPSSPRYSQMAYNSYVRNGQFQWGQALYGMG
ncbi:putative secreted protein [Kutzneria albida DSM 43870]|uniref:Putative secreted protein n=1 Tax=Kutzneria albida DSM 43870 TaxID=1449976 RepID=W5WF81_9PSEU|nr:putative secreted protein [Kutzneria albida DSM 43870]